MASTSTFSSNFTGIVQSLTVGCTIKRSKEDKVFCHKATAGKLSFSPILSRMLADMALGVETLLVVTLSFRY